MEYLYLCYLKNLETVKGVYLIYVNDMFKL